MADSNSRSNLDSVPLALRLHTSAMRSRWRQLVDERYERKRLVKATKIRGNNRTLYALIRDEWWTEVQNEIFRLKKKIAKAGYAGSTVPKSLWLPTVIDNPERLCLKIYQAMSVKPISPSAARDFARKKAKYEGDFSMDKSYEMKSITGRNYRIQYSNERGSHYVSFTEWAVCLSDDKASIPRISIQNISGDSKKEFEGAICSHNNRALFERTIETNEDAEWEY